jgi:hypothetical protein
LGNWLCWRPRAPPRAGGAAQKEEFSVAQTAVAPATGAKAPSAAQGTPAVAATGGAGGGRSAGGASMGLPAGFSCPPVVVVVHMLVQFLSHFD